MELVSTFFNYKAVVTKYNNPEGIIYNNHTGLAANKGYLKVWISVKFGDIVLMISFVES